MSWAVTRIRFPDLRTLPTRTVATFSVRPISRISRDWSLNAKAEVRAATRSERICESAAISSSVRPALKYSSSGLPPTFSNGSTATDRSASAVGTASPLTHRTTASRPPPAFRPSSTAITAATPHATRHTPHDGSARLGTGAGSEECRRELLWRGKPVGLRFPERAYDRHFYVLGNLGAQTADMRHRIAQVPTDDGLRSLPRVRRLTGEHLVEHAPQRVHIGSPIHVR